MKFTRTFLTAVCCFLVAFGSTQASEKAKGATGTTEGTFAGIEQGDYLHFQIKDKTGHEVSFIVLQDNKTIEPYVKNPSQLKGRSIRVFWKEEMIPEAGEKMKTLTKVEARQPLDH